MDLNQVSELGEGGYPDIETGILCGFTHEGGWKC
jgi:hypothetical protein